MAHVKRPSKSVIVNKALEFVFDAQVREHALVKENNDLRRQVDQLRLRLSMPPLPPPAPLPSAAGMAHPGQPQFSRSFSGADLEDLKEEIGGATGLAQVQAQADQRLTPDMLQQHPSPASYVQAAAGITSPASSIMAGMSDGMSPAMAYPTLFGQSPVASSTTAGSPTNSSGSPAPVEAHSLAASAAPATSPFLAHAPHQMAALSQQQGLTAQTQALLQAQFGYMQPSLLTQQHALLMAAAHGQQMQAAQMQQMGGSPGMQDVYGAMGSYGAGQQQQAMGGWGMGVAGVNPYEYLQPAAAF